MIKSLQEWISTEKYHTCFECEKVAYGAYNGAQDGPKGKPIYFKKYLCEQHAQEIEKNNGYVMLVKRC